MDILNITPKYQFSWDSQYWRKYPTDLQNAYTAKDWNQTLVTMLNQAAATIGKSSLRGGANAISIHWKLLPLIAGLEYFNQVEMTIAGRYHVMINDKIPEDKIYVYRNNYPLDVVDNFPEDFEGIKTLVISSESPELGKYQAMDNVELIIVYPSDILAEITILN